MPSTSNPTSRVLDVLSFLAAHPTEAFTLAELARHVGLSKASAHRILTTMVEARFLSRHPAHKTFTLGMAPIAIGEAALEKHRGIEIARREIVRLAAELNAQCTVAAIVDDDLLLLAKESAPQSRGGHHRVGERTPMVPPVGIGLVAFGDQREIDAYLAKAAEHLSEAMQAHLKAGLDLIRRRGYSAAAVGPRMRRLRQTMILPIGRKRDAAYWSAIHELTGDLSAEEIQLMDLGDAGAMGVSYISAPVFSPAGEPVLELVVSGLPADLGARDIEACAERICAAGAVVTNAIHGAAPRFSNNSK